MSKWGMNMLGANWRDKGSIVQLSTQKLKQLRKHKGWSQEVLAKSTGLSLRTIQRIETKGVASAESTLAISSAYEVTPLELFDEPVTVSAHWSKSGSSQVVLALLLFFLYAFGLFAMVANMTDYLDLPSLLFTVLFASFLMFLGHGLEGCKNAFLGLKYLFATEVVGGNAAKELASIYRAMTRALYAGATIMFLIGLVQIIRLLAVDNSPQMIQDLLRHTIPVMILPYLYVVLLSESIFRPLYNKLHHANETMY